MQLDAQIRNVREAAFPGFGRVTQDTAHAKFTRALERLTRISVFPVTCGFGDGCVADGCDYDAEQGEHESEKREEVGQTVGYQAWLGVLRCSVSP